MLKRQQQKRQSKMIRRRLAMPKRVSQQPGSTEQLEQLLSTLPTLAFEPELADLRMDKIELKTLLDSDSKEVDILMKLLTEDFKPNPVSNSAATTNCSSFDNLL